MYFSGEFRYSVLEFIEFCKSKSIYLFDAENPYKSIDVDDILFEMFDINKAELELELERQALLNSFST